MSPFSQGRGELLPDHVPVVPPWATVFGLVIMLRYMYGYVCRPIKILWLCLFSFVCSVFALCLFIEDRLRVGQNHP